MGRNQILLHLFLFIWAAKTNLWDNIFSETEASSPIILSESINFKFPLDYEDIELECTVDYNHELKLLTIIGAKSIILFTVEAFRIQIDLDHYLVSVSSMIQECQRYLLVLNGKNERKIGQIKLNSKFFLINLAFEYVGRNKYNKSNNQYVFMPDLFTEHTDDHDQFQMNPVLIVDKTGAIVKIYEDREKSKQVPFKTKSQVTKKMRCEGEIKQFTKEDLNNIVKDGIKNKQYEKIPGFEAEKIPKIPDIDFSKLPKLSQ